MKPRTLTWAERTVVYSVDISPDGRWLAAGALAEAAVCVWDLEADEAAAELTLAKSAELGTEVRFSPDGAELLARIGSGTSGKQAERGIELGTWKVSKRGGGKGSRLPVLGPNGRTCICGKPSQKSKWQVLAEVYDGGGKRISIIKTPEDGGVPESVSAAAWLPNGELLIAHATSVGVGVYDAGSGELLRRFEDAPNKRKYRGNDWVTVAPSGHAIATTREDDRTARVWRAADNDLLHECGGHAKSDGNYHPLRACFSPDGAVLVVNAGQKKGGGAVTLHALGDLVPNVEIPPDPEEAEANAVDALMEETVRALSALRDVAAKNLDPALTRYLERGSELGCSPLMLRDYFSISSPTIPEQAGCTAEQVEAIEARYELLSQKLFG